MPFLTTPAQRGPSAAWGAHKLGRAGTSSCPQAEHRSPQASTPLAHRLSSRSSKPRQILQLWEVSNLSGGGVWGFTVVLLALGGTQVILRSAEAQGGRGPDLCGQDQRAVRGSLFPWPLPCSEERVGIQVGESRGCGQRHGSKRLLSQAQGGVASRVPSLLQPQQQGERT